MVASMPELVKKTALHLYHFLSTQPDVSNTSDYAGTRTHTHICIYIDIHKYMYIYYIVLKFINSKIPKTQNQNTISINKENNVLKEQRT